MDAEEWIINEDSVTSRDRKQRLQWLLDHTPENTIWIFHGGLLSQQLFEQTRYCYIYGQFLATIILGLSFVEHMLAALFFVSGRDELERANLASLIENAFNVGWINNEEQILINNSREIRNAITHFRKPGSDSSLEKLTLYDPEDLEALLNKWASQMMIIVFSILNRFSVR